MTARPTDPLLLAAHVLIIIVRAIVVIAGAALAIGLPIILFMSDTITAEMREEFANPDIVFPLAATSSIMLLAGAILALAFLFLRNLRRIIGTVGEGDPFVPINARRLTEMGWLALAMQLLAIPAAGFALYISDLLEDEGEVTIDASLDLTGVILVLLLFILARVFRHGAAMREDLEGTV